MISWRGKKQNIVARSNVEAEYCAMEVVAVEITWLWQLFQQLKFGDIQDTKLICDNRATLHIASI